MYTLTLDKIHDIALLKLIGARNRVIVGLILQQALLMGMFGYGLAWWLGQYVFPYFPRRVMLETPDLIQLAFITRINFNAGQPLGDLEGDYESNRTRCWLDEHRHGSSPGH